MAELLRKQRNLMYVWIGEAGQQQTDFSWRAIGDGDTRTSVLLHDPTGYAFYSNLLPDGQVDLRYIPSLGGAVEAHNRVGDFPNVVGTVQAMGGLGRRGG